MDKAVDWAPDNLEPLVHRAWVYLAVMQFDRALQESRAALDQAPDNPYCLLVRAAALQSVNETTDALKILSQLTDLTTATPELLSLGYSQIGWATYCIGDLVKSREAYEMAARTDPDSGDLHYGYALLLARLGDLAGANKEVGLLIQDAPDRSDTYVCRGELRRQSGDLAGALDDFGEALKRNPRKPEVYGYRALVHLAKGETAEAASDFERCYSMDAHQKPYFERLASQIKAGAAGAK